MTEEMRQVLQSLISIVNEQRAIGASKEEMKICLEHFHTWETGDVDDLLDRISIDLKFFITERNM